MRQIGTILAAFVVGLMVQMSAASAQSRDGFGNQWVHQHPFTLMGFTGDVSYLNGSMTGYTGAGFNTLLVSGDLAAAAQLSKQAGVPWMPLASLFSQQNLDDLRPYGGGVGFHVNDEPPRANMGIIATNVELVHSNYPNALAFSNAFPDYASNTQLWGDNTNPSYTYDQYLDDFISIIKPDVMMYDYYPFQTNGTRRNPGYFSNLMLVRDKAKAAGLPYWGYVQAFADGGWRQPSESDMRMQMFSMLTAGYTGLAHWTYGYQYTQSGLADNTPAHQPTALYAVAQEVNPEVAHLGKALRLLNSTDVRFVAGQDTAGGAPHATPTGLSNWTAGAGGVTHLLSLSVSDSGTSKDGLIGFFSDDQGQPYFMLTNLNQDANLSPEQAAVVFKLTFDSSITELLRLNRLTGEQELVPLTNHILDLTLPGGTGDLFKYNTGDFVVPEPTALGWFSVAAGLMLKRRRSIG